MRTPRHFEARLRQTFLLAVVVMLVGGVAPVYAYIDPGPATIVLQLALGGVAGVLLVIRLCWSRIKETLFGPKKPKAGEP